MSGALHFEDVSVVLRSRTILKDVSGAFQPGQITVILGPNGAGKSTLLSCLAGIRTPNAGRISVGNDELLNLSPHHRAKLLGYLPQKAEIHWNLKVRALIRLGRLPHHRRWHMSAQDDLAIEAAMADTDTTHLAERSVQRLSGGEQARVLLARVLAGEPKWILADEPLANLDPAHQLDAIKTFRTIADRGTGIVLILHDLTLAARIADQIIIMSAGMISAQGASAEVLTRKNAQQAFDIDVFIGKDDTGAPVFIPMGRA